MYLLGALVVLVIVLNLTCVVLYFNDKEEEEMPNINHDVTCLKDVKDYNAQDALEILNQLIAREDFTTNHVILEGLEYVKQVVIEQNEEVKQNYQENTGSWEL